MTAQPDVTASSPPLRPAASAPRRRPPGLWRDIGAGRHGNLVRFASVALTLLAWEWYGRGVDPVFLSYPTAILAAVPAMLATGELQRAFVSSVLGLAIGLAAAISLGTLLGLLMGRYRFIDQLLDVQINALYATPNVALIPLLIPWFGLGLLSKVGTLFPAG